MTQTFAVDANNDLYIGDDDRLVMVDGITAVTQVCEQVAKTRLGELVLAVDDGLPFFEAVWTGTPDLARFEEALRADLSAVPDVLEVTTLTMRQTGDTLSYQAQIITVYGPGVVNG